VKIGKHLAWKGMRRIPHNRIHKILVSMGKVKKTDKKIRRKKWARYERRHSNSLWHTDFCEIGGKQLISCIDDAFGGAQPSTRRPLPGVTLWLVETMENRI